MIKENNGNLITDTEVLGKRIDGVNINIKDTAALSRRLDDLVADIEKTRECKKAYSRLEKYYKEIEQYLPEDKKSLISNIDDCLTEILIICEEYFYKNGYYDNSRTGKLKEIIRRAISWLKYR